MRNFRLSDHIISQLDNLVRTVVPNATQAQRDLPVEDNTPSVLTINQSRLAAGLMRVNHSGEVCAQALYNGQAFSAKDPLVAEQMQQAASEEKDHLVWCERRLEELGSHASLFNPVWYSMSFALGAIAGAAGDKYSLGFVAETERQVSSHLQNHLQRLPLSDTRTRSIITQMDIDEQSHHQQAIDSGAVELPAPVQHLMGAVSKVMTTASYYL